MIGNYLSRKTLFYATYLTSSISHPGRHSKWRSTWGKNGQKKERKLKGLSVSGYYPLHVCANWALHTQRPTEEYYKRFPVDEKRSSCIIFTILTCFCWIKACLKKVDPLPRYASVPDGFLPGYINRHGTVAGLFVLKPCRSFLSHTFDAYTNGMKK